jgi:hypothetical protein
MSQPTTATSTRVSTRRRFLQNSALAATALGTLTLSRAVHAAGDSTIKIGMIGAGGRCSGAADESMASSPDVKLVAMCDLFENRVKGAREALKARWPNQVQVDDDHCFTGFDGYQKVIEASDAVMIEAVVVVDLDLIRPSGFKGLARSLDPVLEQVARDRSGRRAANGRRRRTGQKERTQPPVRTAEPLPRRIRRDH